MRKRERIVINVVVNSGSQSPAHLVTRENVSSDFRHVFELDPVHDVFELDPVHDVFELGPVRHFDVDEFVWLRESEMTHYLMRRPTL